MTSTHNPLSDFILTPQQQSLLFAALNSNKGTGSPVNNALTMSPSSFGGSPVLDYDYDFNNGDSSFDFSFDHGNEDSRMIGDLPGAPSTTKSDSVSDQDSPDKRSHPEDDDEEENGAKRRESGDKVTKKPGRKPLTTEPTSVSLGSWSRELAIAYRVLPRSGRPKTGRLSVLSANGRRGISRI
jgi:AP-1-like factor